MRISSRLIILVLLMWGMSLQQLYAQRPELSFRQFTTADGLPSSETYFTLEDSKGYIWIGTDNGLARFDGYEFRVYDGDDGLSNAVVFVGLETEGGDFWVSTFTGECFKLEGEVFVPFEHNEQILKLKQTNPFVKIIDVLRDGSIVLVTENQGIIKISAGGTMQSLTDVTQSYLYIYRPESKATRFSAQVRLIEGGSREPGKWVGRKPVMFVDAQGRQEIVPDLQVLVSPRHTVVMDGTRFDEGILVSSLRAATYFKGGRVTFATDNGFNKVIHFERYDSSTYFLSAIHGGGLLLAKMNQETQRFELDTLLRKISVSMSFLDSKGGLWVTCLNEGVYYCSNPAQRLIRLRGDNDYLKPRTLALGDNNDLFIGYGGGNVYHHRLDSFTANLVDVYEPSTNGRHTNIVDIHYDHDSRYIYFSKYEVTPDQNGNYNSYADYTLRANQPYGANQYYSTKRFREFNGQLVWSNPSAFGKFDLSKGMPLARIVFSRDRDNFFGFRNYAIFPDGREFVGTIHGLREVMPDSTLRNTNLGIPALDERIEDIVQLNEAAVIIGTRGKGLVYYSADTSFLINNTDGLASDNIRNLHVAENGTLWVATFKGISKIDFPENGHGYHLRTFSAGRGLVDNEVHDIDSRGNEVWLASTAGVYRFVEPPADTTSLPPTLDWVKVNGIPWENATYTFSPEQRNITFQFTTTIFSLGDKVTYRYRINDNQEWQTSQSRIANYPNLPAGAYTFQVQSQNTDGIWSESLDVPIRVEAYFLETWKPWAIGCLLVFSGLFLWFKIRENNSRREQALLLRINELEHSALHAQMNPHFVFNSLNSIQNFVLHNKTREAATYLSRFATLIRATLRASVRGQHSLTEEVKMLKGYLDLEKLRFKEVFDYQISVAPSLPQDDITIPPLLVQPFVENAILHGLRDCTEGGLIEVDFAGSDQQLVVTISDNGVGIEVETIENEDSFGMAITRERLKIMSEDKQPELNMSIAAAIGPDGKVTGTIVTLKITPIKVPLTP